MFSGELIHCCTYYSYIKSAGTCELCGVDTRSQYRAVFDLIELVEKVNEMMPIPREGESHADALARGLHGIRIE